MAVSNGGRCLSHGLVGFVIYRLHGGDPEAVRVGEWHGARALQNILAPEQADELIAVHDEQLTEIKWANCCQSLEASCSSAITASSPAGVMIELRPIQRLSP